MWIRDLTVHLMLIFFHISLPTSLFKLDLNNECKTVKSCKIEEHFLSVDF